MNFHATSQPLSLKRVFGVPWMPIQCWIKFWTKIEDCLLLNIAPALKRVYSSMICKYHRLDPNSCKSTAIVALKSDASGKLSLAGGGLYFAQSSQLFTTSTSISNTLLLSVPAFFNNILSITWLANISVSWIYIFFQISGWNFANLYNNAP